MNIPVLTKMNIEHLFLIDILEGLSLVCILDVGLHLNDRSDIHKCGGVDGIVFSVFKIAARLSSSHQTFIFKIISHQTSIMNDFSQGTSIQYIVVVLEISFLNRLTDVSSEALSEHHSKNRPPSFASSVK
jgi:hypothetical protein